MAEERTWILIARKLSGDLTTKQAIELEQILNEDTMLRYQAEVIINFRTTEPVIKKAENNIEIK